MLEKEKCVQLLLDNFLTRRDVVAARQQWRDRRSGEWISRPRPVMPGEFLENLVAFHVYGPNGRKAPPLNYVNNKTGALVADGRGFDRLGAYAVTPENTSGWLCLDFDGPGHPLPLADPQATMLACLDRCRALGVPGHIEMSGGGHGWHLWVFFENPVPASDARLLGHRVAPTDHVLVTGEPADIRTGRGIECFPKQNSVSDKKIGIGNLIWLPHWHGAKDGGNQFYQVTDGGLAPYAPEGFERLATTRLQEILAQVPDDIRRFVLKTKGGLKAPSAPKSSPPATLGNYAPTDAQMIQAALDHISPDVSYDNWLRIGMALHHWDPQAGFAIWDAWSTRGEKYVDGEPSLKWDGFTSGGGVTLGTLFDMAKKAGWSPPEKQRAPLPSDEEIAAFMDVDPAELLDQVRSEKQRKILGCLLEANRPLTPKEVAAAIGKDHNSTKVLLHRMAKDGKVQSDDAGGYILGADVTHKGCITVTLPVTFGENVTRKTPQAVTFDGNVTPNVTRSVTSEPNVTTNVTGPILKNVTASDGPRLPAIVVNRRHFRHIRDEAWSAVHASNYPPRLFQRGGAPVCLTFTKDVPEIIPVDATIMFDHLCNIASWIHRTPDMETPDNPPKELPMVMVKRPSPALPHIEAVVCTPIFDRQGNLIQSPGYHREARLYMHIALGTVPVDVPAHPTDTQIADAIALLREDLFVDFPFTSPAGLAHALAALLLPFVRRMVVGPTPVHLIESPSPGTGKTLLAKVISMIVLGKVVSATSLDLDEQAVAKKITAILLGAPQVVLIDNINVRTGLKSAALAAALTAEPYSERVLYQPGMTELPNQALWLITANNPSTSLEIARRCVNIRIDSRRDRPWLIHGFKHEPLLDWVEENRAELLAAILTIVRGWVAAGMLPGSESFGSFDS